MVGLWVTIVAFTSRGIWAGNLPGGRSAIQHDHLSRLNQFSLRLGRLQLCHRR